MRTHDSVYEIYSSGFFESIISQVNVGIYCYEHRTLRPVLLYLERRCTYGC